MFKIIKIIILLIIAYFVLGYFEIIPTYRCNTTMGDSGVVKFCEWRKGPSPIY